MVDCATRGQVVLSAQMSAHQTDLGACPCTAAAAADLTKNCARIAEEAVERFDLSC
jgi:hypothetical protein